METGVRWRKARRAIRRVEDLAAAARTLRGGPSATGPISLLGVRRRRGRGPFHRVLPVGNPLVILQAEDPDRVPAQDIVTDEYGRLLLVEMQANRELSGVLDLRLSQDRERPEPLTGPPLLVHEDHGRRIDRIRQRRRRVAPRAQTPFQRLPRLGPSRQVSRRGRGGVPAVATGQAGGRDHPADQDSEPAERSDDGRTTRGLGGRVLHG